MEKITEILNNVKERLSNPLLFSFACSWLIINWQIPVALLWFNTKQLEIEGYSTIFKFISSKLNYTTSILHPLLFALIYTFMIPVIRNLIQAFYSWTTKWGENWILKISQNSKVNMAKYLKLRIEYEQRNRILEDIIIKETELSEKYNLTKTELLETKSKLDEALEKLSKSDSFIHSCNDISILTGAWETTYKVENKFEFNEDILIKNADYSIISTLGHVFPKYVIRDLFYNERDKSVFFVKELIEDFKTDEPTTEHFKVNRLKFIGKDILSGTENGTVKVAYKRN